MKYHKNLFITVMTICVLFSKVTYSSPDEGSILKLLKLSGITEAVEQIPHLISEGFIEGFTEAMTVTDEEEKALLDDVNQSFSSSFK